MRWEERMLELAGKQEGLVAAFHAAELEITRDHWRRARENGRWLMPSPRVLAARGSVASDAQRALAGVFDGGPGTVLHGGSALALFGLRGFDLREVQVSRPRGGSRKPVTLATVHTLRAVREHHLMIFKGVPTQTPLRAIWTVARAYSAPYRHERGLQRVGRLLDDAHKARLVTWTALHEMVEDIRRQGRGGSLIMRELAAQRPIGSSPSESRNEDRLEELLRERGIRPLKRQVDIGGHEPIGRTDYLDSEEAAAFEVNSITHHTTPSDRATDKVRYRRYNEAGFAVGVLWEDDLWRDPASVTQVVTRVREHARRGDMVELHSPSCPWPDAVLVSPRRA